MKLEKKEPKPGMRTETRLWVLSFVFVLASFLSWLSTQKGMVTLFFVGQAGLALLASAVVQITEIVFSGSWKSFSFWLAFLISVSLSSFQFVETAYPAGQFREVAETGVNHIYTELLPKIQKDTAAQLDDLRTTVFSELDALEAAADAEGAASSGNIFTTTDAEDLKSRYAQQTSRYPKGYENDIMLQNLLTAVTLVHSGDTQNARLLIEQSVSALDGLVDMAATGKQKAFYRDIRSDYNALGVLVSLQENTGAAAVSAGAKAMRSALMKGTLDTGALRADADTLVAQAMAAELPIDTAKLAILRDSVLDFAALVELNTRLKEHQAEQPALAQRLAAAGAAEDDQQALEGVQTVWREELEGLRAEIAASPLSNHEDLTTLDKMTSVYLQKERNSIQTTWAVLHIQQVGIRNALPAIGSILLAALLDLSASAAFKSAKELRRQRAKERFFEDCQPKTLY
jgi:hypothetical protein